MTSLTGQFTAPITIRRSDRFLISKHVDIVRRETGCDNWPEQSPINLDDVTPELMEAWAFVQGYAAAVGLTTEELLAAFNLAHDFATIYLKPEIDLKTVEVFYSKLSNQLEVEVGIEPRDYLADRYFSGSYALNIYNYDGDGAYKNLYELVECSIDIIGKDNIAEIPLFDKQPERQSWRNRGAK